jgi:hypothetical protein
MTEIINLNELKKILCEIASDKKITTQTLKDDWSVDYGIDLQEDFYDELKNVQYGIKLYRDAIDHNDKLTARVALIRISLATQALSGFFDSFHDDLVRIYTGEQFDWPEFTEDYKIPAHYEYKGPK